MMKEKALRNEKMKQGVEGGSREDD